MANKYIKKDGMSHPWPYGRIDKCIERVEEDGQPWAVARYHGKARFVSGEGTYFYELLIFQTFDAESPVSCMLMDRETYRDTIDRYGLTKRHAITEGEVYSQDDRLRDLVKRYLREYNGLNAEYEVAHENRLKLGRLLSHGERPGDNGVSAASREGWIAREKVLKDRLSGFRKTFAEKHGLIIYTF